MYLVRRYAIALILSLLPTVNIFGAAVFTLNNGSPLDSMGAGATHTEFDGDTPFTITTVDVLAPEYTIVNGLAVPTGNILSSAGGGAVGTNVSPGLNGLGVSNMTVSDNQYQNTFGSGTEAGNINPGEAWIMEFDKDALVSYALFQSLDSDDEMTITVEGLGTFVPTSNSSVLPFGLTVVPAGTDIKFELTGTLPSSAARIAEIAAQVVLGTIDSAMSGNASVGSTWLDGTPPQPKYFYNVVPGHTVTLDSASFGGDALFVNSGAAIDFAVNSVNLPLLVVQEGATITESTTGNFILGDISQFALNVAEINGDMTINAENGGQVQLNAKLAGIGQIVINGTSGTVVRVVDAGAFSGDIEFNGTGDQVAFFEAGGGGTATFHMNSTGANQLVLSALAQVTAGRFIFNEPGSIDHFPSDSIGGIRLQNVNLIEANAPVTVDMTKEYAGNERRLLTGEWRGASNITVNGTPTAPAVGRLNEFEIGTTSEALVQETNSFSGTVTYNDYVNGEVRENTPSASFVVNQNALFEVGHDGVLNILTTKIGEVTVNSGGTFEIGRQTEDMHVPYTVTVTKSGGKSGGMVLNSGARLLMQISGTGPSQFDQVVAQGDVTLGGTLEILVDPLLTPTTTLATQGTYVPQDGDTFDLIVIGAVSPDGDYDGNGTVGPEDYDIWTSTFGSTDVLDADGNRDNVVDAADYVVWRKNLGVTGGVVGAIDTSTDFSNLVLTDPNNVLAGFTASLNISAAAVQLVINSSGATFDAAVPEPSSAALALMTILSAGTVRRRRM